MGGLFSSEPPRQSTPAYTYECSRLSYGGHNESFRSSSTSYGRNTTGIYGNSGYGGSQRQKPPVTDREVEDILQKFRNLQLNPRKEEIKVSKLDTGLFRFSCYSPVTYTQLNLSDYDYSVISKMVTHKKCFKIDRIERIDNPFLENAYELKKLQKQNERYGCYVQEKLLFHGTKQCLVDEICKFNFDYRKIVKHKYGKGVSFSTNSTYASNYSDQTLYNKVMLVAKVLIVNSCIGNANMIVPPDGYDTSQKGVDGVVTVKYEDNEYYPAFKIHYHTVGQMNHQQQYQQRRRKPNPTPVMY